MNEDGVSFALIVEMSNFDRLNSVEQLLLRDRVKMIREPCALVHSQLPEQVRPERVNFLSLSDEQSMVLSDADLLDTPGHCKEPRDAEVLL